MLRAGPLRQRQNSFSLLKTSQEFFPSQHKHRFSSTPILRHTSNMEDKALSVHHEEKEKGEDQIGRDKQLKMVFHYHEETKHHFNRYARSAGRLDWKNQPSPWRVFEGAPTIQLPIAPPTPSIPYPRLYSMFEEEKESQVGRRPTPLNRDSLSSFLYHSLALSAWKKHGDSSWSLRVNPSSGNLHPTEGYIIIPKVLANIQDQEGSGVYHYLPRSHQLERRCFVEDNSIGEKLIRWGIENIVIDELSQFEGMQIFFVALTSIHWRESWKYGERAYRYCNHDVGHALAALRMAGSLLGWDVILLNGVNDDSLSRVLGIDRHADFHKFEEEEADLLAMVVVRPDQAVDKKIKHNPRKTDIPADIVDKITSSDNWAGKAKALSKEHVDWEIIGKAARACHKENHIETTSPTTRAAHNYLKEDELPSDYKHLMTTNTAAEIIRQRRSAVDFDGTTTISRGQFYGILSRLVPYLTEVPWDVWPPEWGVKAHLALFVHRVEGLPAGLYALLRDESQLESFKNSLQPEKNTDYTFGWVRLNEEHGAPRDLPLYLLGRGNVKDLAARVSCTQEIAGDGVFSLGMLVDYEDTLNKEGAHAYRRLFWETGMIGQILYLEAEGQEIRGTGIGCFFDDAVHTVLGIEDKKYQSFYHFTLGGPVEDPRLRTLSAYKAE